MSVGKIFEGEAEGLAEDLGFSPLNKAAESSSSKSGVQDPIETVNGKRNGSIY